MVAMLSADDSSIEINRKNDWAGEWTKGGESIRRAIVLLHAVKAHNEQGIRLSAVARNVGLHIATTRRILTVLTEEGLLSYDPTSNLYRLGYGLFSLGSDIHQFSVKNQLVSTLNRIALETEDSVFLFAPSGLDAVCVSRVDGKYPIRVSTVDIGDHRPLGIGAGSIAILCALEPAAADKIISANSDRYPKFNNQTPEEVKNLVDLARKIGYAVYDRHVGVDMTAVGVPVGDRKGKVVASISVSSIPSRMNHERRHEVAELIKTYISHLPLVL